MKKCKLGKIFVLVILLISTLLSCNNYNNNPSTPSNNSSQVEKDIINIGDNMLKIKEEGIIKYIGFIDNMAFFVHNNFYYRAHIDNKYNVLEYIKFDYFIPTEEDFKKIEIGDKFLDVAFTVGLPIDYNRKTEWASLVYQTDQSKLITIDYNMHNVKYVVYAVHF